MNQTRILLDTDIGDDIDDALALAMICGSPELELTAVTTVYGNVAARSRQTRTMLHLAGGGCREVPVAAGCSAALTPRDIAKLHPDANAATVQDGTSLDEAHLPRPDARHGVTVLLETLARDPAIIPITIGALTNLAVALTLQPALATRIPRLVTMAAEFRQERGEYNILCDPVAAAIVFESGIPMDIITWSAGRATCFTPAQVARFAQTQRAVAQYVVPTIERWQGANTRPPALFDPLAVAAVLRPELIVWKRGHVRVVLEPGGDFGRTLFTEDESGPHRISWDVHSDAALEFCIERMLRA